MSEVRYDEDEPTQESIEALYEIELSSLDENEEAQVKEAISEAEWEGELDQLDIDSEIHQANVAEENREQAEDAQHEQAHAAEAGDYDQAREAAEEVEANLSEAQAQGGSVDNAVNENEADVMVLQEADYQQEVAEDLADDAVIDAELDDAYDDATLEDAVEADQAADDYAEQGDQGGYYGDQSIHTDNNV